jgi:broad specificity phosphatase PhoE
MGQQQYPICNTNIITNGYLEELRDCTLFASPLRRSTETVDFVVKKFSFIKFKVRVLDSLAERGLGDFEGKLKAPIKKNTEFFENEKFIVTKTPPNGESIVNFRNRVANAVYEIQNERCVSDILVISHLQTLRMIRFCIYNSYNYEEWHNINYLHGEVVQESYGQE